MKNHTTIPYRIPLAREGSIMIMIRRTRLAAVLFLMLVLAGCGGKPPRGHYEKAGGFSYDPPKGWQIIEVPGLKYRISRGPPENGFARNMNVVADRFSG